MAGFSRKKQTQRKGQLGGALSTGPWRSPLTQIAFYRKKESVWTRQGAILHSLDKPEGIGHFQMGVDGTGVRSTIKKNHKKRKAHKKTFNNAKKHKTTQKQTQQKQKQAQTTHTTITNNIKQNTKRLDPRPVDSLLKMPESAAAPVQEMFQCLLLRRRDFMHMRSLLTA